MDPRSVADGYFEKNVYPYLQPPVLVVCRISIIHNFCIAASFVWARPSMTKTASISFFNAAADGFNSFNLALRLVDLYLFPPL
ncbi:unnamed protein product [Allacma fusca]|uniref:Uncharacterized protein n=1 Tax=Allacma fusca TaxID=39272 RepID=A0A8J2PSZ5_9HEXA|nr:unnamed protein product [Allacma fusca]